MSVFAAHLIILCNVNASRYWTPATAAFSMDGVKTISDVMHPRIHQAATENSRLKRLFSQCMPPATIEQILFARIADDTIRITTGNSVWAARIRFYSRELIKLTSRQYPSVRQVSIHVLPASKTVVYERQSNRQKPSAESHVASRISQVADSIEGDELSAALHRLAGNLVESDSTG